MLRPDVDVDSAIAALGRAIVATFDESRWYSLTARTGKVDLKVDCPRLLRAMRFNDADYPAEALRALRRIVGGDRNILMLVTDIVELEAWLQDNDSVLHLRLFDGVLPPQPLATILTQREREVLAALQREVVAQGTAAGRHDFRIAYIDSRSAIDKLVNRGLIRAIGVDRYALRRTGLLAGGDAECDADLMRAVSLIEPLRERYRKEPARSLVIQVADLSVQASMTMAQATRALRVVADVPPHWPVQQRGELQPSGEWVAIDLREAILDVNEREIRAKEVAAENVASARTTRPVDQQDRHLLREIAAAVASGSSVDVWKFRILHEAERGRVNTLMAKKLLIEDAQQDSLSVSRLGLIACDSDEARRLLGASIDVLRAAQDLFKAGPEEDWTFDEVARRSRVDIRLIGASLDILNDVPSGLAWSRRSGRSASTTGSVCFLEHCLDITGDRLMMPGPSERPFGTDSLSSQAKKLTRPSPSNKKEPKGKAVDGYVFRGGQTLGGWRLEAPLGKGGQGETWRVRHASERHAPPRAMKLCFDTDEKARERFRREVNFAQAVTHQHVIAILDVSLNFASHVHDFPECAYFTMPYCSGGSLADLNATAENPLLALSYFVDACRGISALHSLMPSVLHRDIKPSNLLIAPEPRHVVVADLGIAAEEDAQGDLTSTQEVAGSLYYRAPEVAHAGNRRHTVRSDIYSLGRVLEFLFARETPSDLDPRPIPRGRQLTDNACMALDAVVKRASAMRPEERFADVKELIAALPALIVDVRIAAPAVVAP